MIILRKFSKNPLIKIILLVIIWRIFLQIILAMSLNLIPFQPDFLGGGINQYLNNPHFWAWANFDGEHYLSIAFRGYQPLTYFFFPVYPLLIKSISSLFSENYFAHALVSLGISHVSLVFALFSVRKLVRLDFDEKISDWTIALILLFPTSFYFAGAYTESLFLALAVWGLYFARQKEWGLSSFLAGILSATRIVGISLAPAVTLEYLSHKKFKLERNDILKTLFLGVCGMLGILIYMYFLNLKTGDFLEFLTKIEIFGAQRSSKIILLPQVFYRYIFKILPNINYTYFPIVVTTWMEMVSAVLFLALLYFSLKSQRLSYFVYFFLTFMIPTFSGSFSSLPRYVLICFPGFILMAVWINKQRKKFKILAASIMVVLLSILSALFFRGIWVA